MSLNFSSSVPSLVSLESRRPPSFSFSSSPSPFPSSASSSPRLSPPSLVHAASTLTLGSVPSSSSSHSPSPSPSSTAVAASLGRPSSACCFVSVGHQWSTGVLCCHLGVYFILTNNRSLPDANSASSAYAIFNYQTPQSVRVTLDPRTLFLTSPADSLDFTLVSLSQSSFARLEEMDLLSSAYQLEDHVDKRSLARHMALDIYQHHPMAPLQCAPGYLHCQYPTWIAYAAACHPKACGGLIVRGDELVGLHRCRNDSRRWNEGTLIADIVPLVTPYLQAAKQAAASQSWLSHIIKPISPPHSPYNKQRTRSLSPPGSPKMHEQLLVVREKGRIDVLAVLLIAVVVLGWLLHGSVGQQVRDGVSHALDSKWAVNALAFAVVLAFHTGAYFAYKRWRQHQPATVTM